MGADHPYPGQLLVSIEFYIHLSDPLLHTTIHTQISVNTIMDSIYHSFEFYLHHTGSSEPGWDVVKWC